MLLLTQQGGILAPVAWILGKIMEGIYFCFSFVGIENIGLCIIVFTIVVRFLMLPATINQQKSMKLNAIISPEIQKIQKKYEKKKDQQSQLAMQQEVSAVYKKYGTSPTGSCLQLLIQIPIMFGLYRVIMNIPAYVGQVKDYYVTIINNMSVDQIKQHFDINVESVKQLSSTDINQIVDSMSGYTRGKIEAVNLSDLVSSLNNENINIAFQKITHMNQFLGINLTQSPRDMWATIGWFALIIPILAGITQFLTVHLSSKMNSGNAAMNDNPAMSSMKTMNYIMPFMSAFFCWGFATGIGLYWIAGSAVMVLQQIFINSYFKKISVEDIIAENQEKAKKKRAKKGIPENQITNAASINTKAVDNKDSLNSKEKEEKLNKAKESYRNKEDNNSISSRANMVKNFNEKNK